MLYHHRPLLAAVALAVMVFGFFCLNYTRGTSERHVEFAQQHQLPPPSRPIFYAGILEVAAGASFIGYLIGSRHASQKS